MGHRKRHSQRCCLPRHQRKACGVCHGKGHQPCHWRCCLYRGDHGMNQKVRAQIVLKQGQFCAGCGVNSPSMADHCHKEGHIRGAVCASCNVTLGKYDDDPAWLRKKALQLLALAEYLESEPAEKVPYRSSRPPKQLSPPINFVVDQIVSRFPRGQSWLARELGTNPSTVASWRIRPGGVPRWWMDKIEKLAEREGIHL